MQKILLIQNDQYYVQLQCNNANCRNEDLNKEVKKFRSFQEASDFGWKIHDILGTGKKIAVCPQCEAKPESL